MNDNELCHHGINGQKWGKRNGPPYPLNVSDRSSSEKKAGWRKSLDKSSEKDDNKSAKTTSDTSENEKKHRLSDKQKKAIKIGAVAVAAALATYGTYKLADSGRLHQLVLKGKSLVKGDSVLEFKKNDKYKKDMDVDEITHTFFGKINPGFGEKKGTTNNCRRCTFAYELSRRGYDVRATRTWHGSGQRPIGIRRALGETDERSFSIIKRVLAEGGSASREGTTARLVSALSKSQNINLDILHRFDTSTLKTKTKGQTIFDALSSMPNHARGELSTSWNCGGGHSMVWEIIRGKPVVFDFQTSKVYKNAEDLSGDFEKYLSTAAFRRLDNAKLDLNFLHRWVTNG